ncbi:hypothetical protein PAMC26577_12020 [Caballeronia sordidicola]|uniref:Uncharacterized protein n=1 Tax=Caballeronia sordidicola TaxID=196367 RepID=A0A242MXH8_CABSO|nr:hypothetical protein PAMC26577_12020 [Caballeronia sordidicola]
MFVQSSVMLDAFRMKTSMSAGLRNRPGRRQVFATGQRGCTIGLMHNTSYVRT